METESQPPRAVEQRKRGGRPDGVVSSVGAKGAKGKTEGEARREGETVRGLGLQGPPRSEICRDIKETPMALAWIRAQPQTASSPRAASQTLPVRRSSAATPSAAVRQAPRAAVSRCQRLCIRNRANGASQSWAGSAHVSCALSRPGLVFPHCLIGLGRSTRLQCSTVGRYGSVGTEQRACNAQQQATAQNCPKGQPERPHTPPRAALRRRCNYRGAVASDRDGELVSPGSQASPAGMGHLRQMDAQDTGRTRAIQRTGAAAQRATTVLPRWPSCNESSQQKQQSIMASAPDDV